ncbi:uncharacterized protein LOC9648199 isoform X2 [Selaginella moellendorffii]|uniref:uncharacterized protein LOC9648199 isoform X2 n=1 Tax=Selaginella moellendorffii TaxID=88036 RepID=UPI000D1C4CEF|nr:uncharacterized protein LOC9648199 isoform X2 [Selaginella moellendorffii]|eukprot:XP_024541192.1 uncharacterized protein LOC9648199 isoform X2 [Selaginella moellendorffii]
MALAAACHASIPPLWNPRSSAAPNLLPPFARIVISTRASIPAHSSQVLRDLASGGLEELLLVRQACESELSAAAFLRARSFYSYPEGRSIAAQEAHQKYMASLEFKTLSSKIAGTEDGFGRVACVVALLPLKDFPPSTDEIRKACKVTVAGQDLLVVGTLDVNRGRLIPGEISGSRPKDSDPAYKRAYISNFCVAQEARRKGVGTALVREAKRTAREWGVSDLYVHVVTSNEPAFKLYTKSGFVFEAEETPAESHLLGRPRRKLLWFDLGLEFES